MSKTSHTRPLSPHLQVYRMGLPATLSILHRLTGIGLFMGSILWIVLLVGVSLGYETCVHRMVHSLLGHGVLFAWVAALYYHLCNGIRHLFWDVGKGFELAQAYRSGWLVVGCSVLLTLLTWVFCLGV